MSEGRKINTSSDVFSNSHAQQNWSTREMRNAGKGHHEASRGEKRGRLGTRIDRAIYKSAKGHLDPRYPEICARADRINK